MDDSIATNYGDGNFVLPEYGLIMKVGPHSGMSLNSIIESKIREELLNGVHYWGYSGTLCRPERTICFISKFINTFNSPPFLLLVMTTSTYSSNIGAISKYSIDGCIYKPFNDCIQLQGAQYAFVCDNLQKINRIISVDDLIVYGGINHSKPLGSHFKGRINKTFFLKRKNEANAHKVLISYRCRIVKPYAIWLK